MSELTKVIIFELKNKLRKATHCTIQHDGWTCATCFFNLSKSLNNKDWQAVLLTRGDYKKSELDNLPKDIEVSIEKILKIIKGMKQI